MWVSPLSSIWTTPNITPRLIPYTLRNHRPDLNPNLDSDTVESVPDADPDLDLDSIRRVHASDHQDGNPIDRAQSYPGPPSGSASGSGSGFDSGSGRGSGMGKGIGIGMGISPSYGGTTGYPPFPDIVLGIHGGIGKSTIFGDA